jgi:hypothetical protein
MVILPEVLNATSMEATSNNTKKRKWIFQLILLILIFLLLGFGIWLYFDLKVKQIKTQDNYIGIKKNNYKKL